MAKSTRRKWVRGIERAAIALDATSVLDRARALRSLSWRQALRCELVRARELTWILRATPRASVPGATEVHMLLHHARIHEGLWALYGLAHFAEQPLHFVVHDDGTLNAADRAKLDRVLPGARVVDRREADRVSAERFRREGLERCQRLREELVFALKLFDPIFFTQSEAFILLDSDVLFVASPSELFDERETGVRARSLYSGDNGYRYCLGAAELDALIGRPVIERFNPGVVRTRKNVIDLARIERYLQHPGFWHTDGSPNYYAELTLWAMELSLDRATMLPSTYAICPDFRVPFVSGHYCGSPYWASYYYSDALPRVARAIVGAL